MNAYDNRRSEVYNQPSSKLRIVAGITLYVVVLFVALCYLLPNLERYRQLFSLSPAHVLLIIIVVVFPEKGLQNYVLYPVLGAPVSFVEAVALSYVNTFANQLPFAGGIVAKGVYLKQRYRLPYTRFLGATAGLIVVAISAGGITGLATIGYLVLGSHERVPWILVSGFALMAIAVTMLWLPIPASLVRLRWSARIDQLLRGKEFLTRDKRIIIKLGFLQLLAILFFSLRLQAAFRLMSQTVPLSYCFLFAAAALLTQLVSLAPGGLGVREAIVATTAHLLGLDIGISIIAVGIDRIIVTATVVVLGLLGSAVLGRRLVTPPLRELTNSNGEAHR